MVRVHQKMGERMPRVILNSYWDTSEDYEIDVPGLNRAIQLVEECNCFNAGYDHDEGDTVYSAKEDCIRCHGTGLRPTSNGNAILLLMKEYGDKK